MSLSYTPNYNLAITSDLATTFEDWLTAMSSTSDSNMTKIDAALTKKGSPVLFLNTAPLASTVGIVDQILFDTTNHAIYQCTSISGSSYTWTLRDTLEPAIKNAATATLEDADTVPFTDASDSKTKKTTWLNFKALLRTYFNSLYAALTHNQAESTITFTDITTGNASVSRHGYLPKLGGNTTTYLRADGTWAAPPASGGGITSIGGTTPTTLTGLLKGNGTDIDVAVAGTDYAASSHTQAESTIAFTDIATGNASVSRHGYLPKLGGGTSTYLRADGTWAAPPAGGGGITSIGGATPTTLTGILKGNGVDIDIAVANTDYATPAALTSGLATKTTAALPMTGYSKPAAASAITASDSINTAIGKLEKGLETAGGSEGGNDTIKSTRIYGGTNMGISPYNNDYSEAYFNTLLPLIAATHCHIKCGAGFRVDPENGYTFSTGADPDFAITKRCLEMSKAHGIVTDMLMLYTENASDWTQPLEPTGTDVPLYFKHHTEAALVLAEMCETYNVPIMGLINESNVLTNSDKASYWAAETAAIRAAYPKLKLTFASTTWNGETRKLLDYKLANVDNICNYVDFIGMNLYPCLTTKLPVSAVTNFDLVNGWYGRDYPTNSTQDCSFYELVTNTYRAYKKPIMITEIGATPKERGLQDPLNIYPETQASAVNKHAQYLYDKTAIDVLGDLDWVAAIYLWDACDTWTPFYWLDNEELVPYVTNYFGGVFNV